MAKKIKITENQLRMLNKKILAESNGTAAPKNRVIKITESQYSRLFERNEGGAEILHEDIGLWETSLDFINYMVGWLNDLTHGNTQDGLDPIWTKIGRTREDFFKLLMDMGIIAVATAKGPKMYRVITKNVILNLKRLYNAFKEKDRYDHNTGKQIRDDNDELIAQEGIVSDLEYDLEETTTAGGVGGSFETPMRGASPQNKFKNYPDDELNEDNIDETTSTGDASGAYVQPKIWAKDPNNSRFSNDPMYPEGKIIKKNNK
jgi:hypothetical protein